MLSLRSELLWQVFYGKTLWVIYIWTLWKPFIICYVLNLRADVFGNWGRTSVKSALCEGAGEELQSSQSSGSIRFTCWLRGRIINWTTVVFHPRIKAQIGRQIQKKSRCWPQKRTRREAKLNTAREPPRGQLLLDFHSFTWQVVWQHKPSGYSLTGTIPCTLSDNISHCVRSTTPLFTPTEQS